MGHSPSIEELQAKDDQFRKYLSTLEADLDQKASAAAEKMRTEVDTFYSDNAYHDAKAFVSGQNTDFLHEKEFSLENLKKVVDGISAAVFAGAAVPPGATTNKDGVQAADAALGSTVGAMSNLELYIAGKVFEVLSNVVLSFGTGSSVTYTSSTKSASLGFGLQMFTSVAASSYQSHSFFTNEYISQYLYMYEVRFSVAQAQTEAKMGLVQAYENQLTNFEQLLDKLGDSLTKGDIDLNAYAKTADQLQELIDRFQEKIDSLKSVARKAMVMAVITAATPIVQVGGTTGGGAVIDIVDVKLFKADPTAPKKRWVQPAIAEAGRAAVYTDRPPHVAQPFTFAKDDMGNPVSTPADYVLNASYWMTGEVTNGNGKRVWMLSLVSIRAGGVPTELVLEFNEVT